MIRELALRLSVLGLCLTLLMSTGCVTTNGPTPPPPSPEKLEKSATLLKGVVRGALILIVDKNGTNATPYIALASGTLTEFIGGTNYTPYALLKSLNSLPAKALKKVEVSLAIGTVVTAYEIFWSDYVRGQVNGNAVAVKLLTAVRDGCDDALLLSP